MVDGSQAIATQFGWESLIAREDWELYRCVLRSLSAAEIPFALGGGLALSFYTGHLRSTKDVDIYVLPQDREQTVATVTDCGFGDYFPVKPYDRNWIHRGHHEGTIIDTIWAMANRRASVDERWIFGGRTIRLFGEDLRVLPPEELIWSKLYVLQRDRCDWPDILNLIHAVGVNLDWKHLLQRVAEDLPLIRGVLSLYLWINPHGAGLIPGWVKETVGLATEDHAVLPMQGLSRADLLDSRPWFLERTIASSALPLS